MYKVLSDNVGGFGGRTFKKGDTVKESDFPMGNAKKLVELKCLELVVEKSAPTQKKKK